MIDSLEVITSPESKYIFVYGPDAAKYMISVRCIKEEEAYVKMYSLTGEMSAICPPLRFVVESLLPENTKRKFLKVNRRAYINKEFITARTEKEILCGGHKFENTEHASLSLPRSQ